MAIAFDAVSGAQTVGSAHTSQTWSHTCSGSDLILFVIIGTYNSLGGGKISGVTYGGVAMTRYNGEQAQQSNQQVSVYYLLNPSTGANNVVASFASQTYSWCSAASYSGVSQSGFPDNEVDSTGTGTSISSTITPVASDCWLVMLVMGNRQKSASTGATYRGQSGAGQGTAIADSNGTVSGSTTIAMTQTVSDSWSYRTFSIAPAGAAAPTFTPRVMVY